MEVRIHVTTAEDARQAEAEALDALKLRQRVYPERVAAKKMTAEDADRKIRGLAVAVAFLTQISSAVAVEERKAGRTQS